MMTIAQGVRVNPQDFMVCVADDMYIHISEGTGDNLLQEDVDDGYVDYIYYEVHKAGLWQGEPVMYEWDGGMVLLKEMYADMDIYDIADRAIEMAGFNIGDYRFVEEV